MGVADRNLNDMPVPDFAYTDRNNGRVFVRPTDPDGRVRKRTIGYMTVSAPGNERMVPNQYFKEKYQDLYSQACPDQKIPHHEMSIGLNALTSGITAQTGLYEDLRAVYGLFTQTVFRITRYFLFFAATERLRYSSRPWTKRCCFATRFKTEELQTRTEDPDVLLTARLRASEVPDRYRAELFPGQTQQCLRLMTLSVIPEQRDNPGAFLLIT